MNTESYLRNMYTDFFGNESISINEEESQKLIDDNISFDEIDNLSISSESISLLKKIIAYMQKYHEGTEKIYIPFRLIIEANTDSITNDIINILSKASDVYNYTGNTTKTVSLYKSTSLDIDTGIINIFSPNNNSNNI